MKGIRTCLWFDHEAEEAARFYTSLFKNSEITRVSHYGEAGAKASGRPKDSVMVVEFEIKGQKFMALNGGPVFPLTEAVSLVVHCKNQDEIDEYWDQLSEGGSTGDCGWLKDRFGLSWQVVPTALADLVSDEDDPARADRVMAALIRMKKLDLETLERAAEEVEVAG